MRLIRKDDIERIATEIANGNEVYVQWADCRRPEEIKRSKVSHLTMMYDLRTTDNEFICCNIDYIVDIYVKRKEADTRSQVIHEFYKAFMGEYSALNNIPREELMRVHNTLLRTAKKLEKED